MPRGDYERTTAREPSLLRRRAVRRTEPAAHGERIADDTSPADGASVGGPSRCRTWSYLSGLRRSSTRELMPSEAAIGGAIRACARGHCDRSTVGGAPVRP